MYLNAIWLTFDGIRHIFATDVYGNQTAHIIFHLPFVVDNIFQFDFRTAVIMFSCATINNYIVRICFVRMQFVTAFEHTVWNNDNEKQTVTPMIINYIVTRNQHKTNTNTQK